MIITTPQSNLRFASSPYTGEPFRRTVETASSSPPCAKEVGTQSVMGGLFVKTSSTYTIQKFNYPKGEKYELNKSRNNKKDNGWSWKRF